MSSITIPPGVTRFRVSVFSESGIEEIHFAANTITEIGEWTFAHCPLLRSSVKTLKKNCLANCSSLTEIMIPSSVTLLDDLVFEGCSSLQTVEILGTEPLIITAGVFFGCRNFQKIIVSGDHPSLTYDADIVLYNKDRIDIIVYLAGCANKDLTIPNTAVTIFAYSFDYAVHIENVLITEISSKLVIMHSMVALASLLYTSLNLLKESINMSFLGPTVST